MESSSFPVESKFDIRIQVCIENSSVLCILLLNKIDAGEWNWDIKF